ncbi:MAG: ABC transporter substrate binding protein [Hyphomicrobiaceae bacterium]
MPPPDDDEPYRLVLGRRGRAATWTFAVASDEPERIDVTRSDAAASADRHILVLYSQPSAAYDIAITRFLSVIAERHSARALTIVNYRGEDARARRAIAEAEHDGTGLILSMGSDTTAWIAANYRGGALPVVSICAKDPVLLGEASSYDEGSGTNIAFTSLNMPIEQQMAYVTALRPDLRHLVVLVDRDNVSARRTQSEPMIGYAREQGIDAREILVERSDTINEDLAGEIDAAVADLVAHDPDLAHSLIWITGSTSLIKRIDRIAAHAGRVPVLSTVTDVVREGDASAVFAVGISFESNAHLAALYALEILADPARAATLPVGVVRKPDIAVSFRRARTIGLRIPFGLLEAATIVFDSEGRLVRTDTTRAPATD